MKKLYRSNRNRIVGGVCGGIGEYLGIDAKYVRITFVALTVITSILDHCLWSYLEFILL